MPSTARLALALLLTLGAGFGVYWFVGRREPDGGVRRPAPSAGRPAPSADPEKLKDDGITGCVRDQRGPVAGARVRVKGTAVNAITDDEGRFRLATRQLTQPARRPVRITAAKDGYLIAGAPFGDAFLNLNLVPLPAEDRADYRWVDPAPDAKKSGNCANCHAEIYREWAGSGHSRSASGRRFRNLYEGTNWDGDTGVGWGLLNDHPIGAGVCASCHAPAIPDDDTAAQFDLRKLSGVATRGVHCDYCHKISGVGDGTIGLTHGRFNLRLLRPASEPRPLGSGGAPPPLPNGRGSDEAPQLFFGPLDDVDRGEDAYSPLYRESRYCASCHEGIVFGVRVYTTYSEWLDSPARKQGKRCQDCHMTPTGTMTNIAPDHGGIERDPKTLANHRFFAGSQEDMLRRCVRVEADAVRVARPESSKGVRLTVRIGAEDVGHRVPTGFIDRHLILAVEARDAAGQLLVVSTGPKLSAAVGPGLSGRPGRLFAKLLTGRDGKAPAPFWLAGGEPDDSRLIPGRTEETAWQFPPEVAQLRIRVLYRRFWAEVVASKGWPDRDIVVYERSVVPH
jgi:hypothetical protein